MYFCNPFSDECVDVLNEAVAYHLHVSHVYLEMAFSFVVDKKMPTFAQFFEREAETRRTLADQYLKQLCKRKSSIYPPFYTKPQMSEIDTPVKAIMIGQELEAALRGILEHLKRIAIKDRETDLGNFLKPLLAAQKKNDDYLKFQLNYQQREERRKKLKTDHRKPTSSGRRVSKPEDIDSERPSTSSSGIVWIPKIIDSKRPSSTFSSGKIWIPEIIHSERPSASLGGRF
ncbi:Ftdc2 [Phodopus roborovskii]|uniref:Ferritin n=1 Tax=Phodopus roborovskii TaxID=109678 RepID=A0AAU9ZJS8_PHORO|nr:Ftdc2 [Phodopus roborovskii]